MISIARMSLSNLIDSVSVQYAVIIDSCHASISIMSNIAANSFI